MNQNRLKLAVKLYDTAWKSILPALRLSSRLKEGYEERRLDLALPAADLWIQAASAGEAYLARAIVSCLNTDSDLRVLVTTNTRQGMDILEKAAPGISSKTHGITLFPGWFPFDRPAVMEKAVCQVNPKLVVLLETEIWPGLLYALKTRNIPACIINGRITSKSLYCYRKGSRLLRLLRPDAVHAVSSADAARFAEIFGKDIVFEMPNIKFDRLPAAQKPEQETALSWLLPKDSRFLVLGSIRQQEEERIINLIRHVQAHHPAVITGLFPRHMHRLDYWKSALSQMGVSWELRSRLKARAKPSQIILWDTFGELSRAYASADAVFVGGSLATLGGQNFLEPLIYGNQPVIGPSWENFSWVGESIFGQGLVLRENNWQAASERLAEQLHNPADREEIRKKAMDYIRARQGGLRKTCRLIEKYLKEARSARKAS